MLNFWGLSICIETNLCNKIRLCASTYQKALQSSSSSFYKNYS